MYEGTQQPAAAPPTSVRKKNDVSVGVRSEDVYPMLVNALQEFGPTRGGCDQLRAWGMLL